MGAPSDLIAQADAFADHAHGAIGQLRKYTGEPYIVHPRAVSTLVADAGGDSAMVAAALLHDVVEDTPTTIGDILAEFGPDVADLVFWLTDASRPEDGNRRARKEIDRKHIAAAPARAKAVKLADLIDNGRSIVEHDRNFAVVYLREKAALLEVLQSAAADCAAAAALLPVAFETLRGGQEKFYQQHLMGMGHGR